MAKEKKLKFAQAYFTDRAYGGPEEGGWWYDVGEHLMSLPFFAVEGYVDSFWEVDGKLVKSEYQSYECDDEAREDARTRLTAYCEAKGFCVRDKDFKIFIDDEPGADFPTERPYYE